MKNVVHLNIVGFRAAVAALDDSALRGRPFVIAGGTGSRVLAWDVSPEAIRQNIRPGMALGAAQKLVRDLIVASPNPAACEKANRAIEEVVRRYAPAWQNDGAGNVFLDITGTRRLFGSPADCACRVQHEILGCLGIRAAMAAAANKLVTKVASRAIRPAGMIEVRPGNEAAFLTHQNITLLPGMGPGLLKTAEITGFREIGEIAALTDVEASALFGKQGKLLRDNALGIDNSPVFMGMERLIRKKTDFPEDVIDHDLIRGALASLVSHAGLEMRNEKLGTGKIRLMVVYGDGVETQGSETIKEPLVLDRDILAAAERLYGKTVTRRIRIRSVCLGLGNLAPLGYQPDLFEMLSETKNRSLQEALDKIQNRHGRGKITRGAALVNA